MFWIHGGGFCEYSGNSNLFGPDFLVKKNVILVTINYRLGVFGFLSLGTPEYSGNMGLKDQQMALEWVYKHIDRFYGDRNRITVFGQSAGKEEFICKIKSIGIAFSFILQAAFPLNFKCCQVNHGSIFIMPL